MPCVVTLTSGEPIRLTDKTATEVKNTTGTWLIATSDSFAGADAKVHIRVGQIAYVKEL